MVKSRKLAVLVGGAFAATAAVGVLGLRTVWHVPEAVAEPAQAPATPQEALREGISQFRLGNYAKASDWFAAAAKRADELAEPERALLKKYTELASTAAARQAEAEKWLTTARQALHQGRRAEAEKAASRVLTNPYASGAQRTQARGLLNQLAKGQTVTPAAAPSAESTGSVVAATHEVPAADAAPTPTSNYVAATEKEAAQKLMAEAVEALRVGDLNRAEQLALQAASYGAKFAKDEVTPQDVLQAVNRARRLRGTKPMTVPAATAPRVQAKPVRPASATSAPEGPAGATAAEATTSAAPPSAIVAPAGAKTSGADEDQPAKPTAQTSEASIESLKSLPHAERKKIARELLKSARELIEAGVLDEAEKLISQAEELNVRWGWFEDSPVRLRRALRRARIKHWFAQEDSQAGAAVSGSKEAKTGSAPGTSQEHSHHSAHDQDSAARAKELVRQAREALASGDLDKAERLALEAQSYEVHYGLFDDTPERVLADVARMRQAEAHSLKPPAELTDAASAAIDSEDGIDAEVQQIPETRPEGSERELRKIAAQLLAEARRRLDQGDWRNAREIARRVKNWNLHYGLFWLGDTPDKVLRACDVLRQRIAARQRVEQKEKARKLLAEARKLIDAGKLDEAEAKVLQAKQLDVAYGLLEVKPDDLLAEIKAVREASGSTPAASENVEVAGAVVDEKKQPAAEVAEHTAAEGSADEALVKALLQEAEEAEKAGDAATAARKRALAYQIANVQPQTGDGQQAAEATGRAKAVASEAAGIETTATTSQASEQAGASVAESEAGRARVVHRGVTPADDSTANARKRLEQAKALYRQGNYPKARAIALEIAESHPELAAEAREIASQAELTELNTVLEIFNAGVAAMRKGEYAHALQLFRQVAGANVTLDPATQQQLQEYLTRLPVLIRQKEIVDVAAGGPQPASMQQGAVPGPMPEELADRYQRERIRLQQLIADTNNRIAVARQKLESDPEAAIAELQNALEAIRNSGLDEAATMPLVRRVEAAIRYVQREKERIELERVQQQAQLAAAEQRARELAAEAQRQKEVQQLIEQGQRLFDQGRFDEAQVMAERARELDPNNVAAHALYWKAKISRRLAEAKQIESLAEEGFVNAMNSVDWSAIPYDDRDPVTFPDAKTWRELTERRKARYSRIDEAFRSQMELEIERKLEEPIAPFDFQQTPLSEVIDFLRDATGVNIVVDWRGLELSGITSNEPVTLRLEGVRFRSALNLLMQQLGLTYSIRDDVLLITTPLRDQGRLISRVYDVADLVVPIRTLPKIVTPMGIFNWPDAQTGGAGAMPFVMPNQPLAQVGVGGSSYDGQSAFGGTGTEPAGTAGPQPAQAIDFDTLIELIKSTVAPDTWEDAGGAGTIAEFPGNLSLVISQTQEVHDQIRDLLQQLRRLQDLQVVIEVRFITLTEDFLERVGVDIDIEIDDDSQKPLQPFGRDTDDDGIADILRDFDHLQSLTVGLRGPDGDFAEDLDIPIRTLGFALGRPANFDTPALQMGVAFLSDLEVFLFLEAVQQDNRSNVLIAPKVTLFNGQQAFVFSGTLRWSVIALFPVVAAGAVAFQPVPQMVLDGAALVVQAVVSADRRYVRVSVSPLFTNVVGERRFPIIASAQQIGFGGGGQTQTLVQAELILPIIGMNILTTTVAVPDGGTVVLGGLKSKTEERREFGTPILNKLPYINRLFMQTGVGTVTQSLLMMVTPRIVILEEEEELRGIAVTP